MRSKWPSAFRYLIVLVLGGACLVTNSEEVLAQTYPSRPIRLVIQYAPGGPTDILGRAGAQKLGELLPEPVLVENRPGAGGVVGVTSVAKAAPDGYTLLLGDVGSMAINPALYKSLPYNARTDFTAVGPVATGPIFLFVGASVPARNVQELIAIARSRPGALSYGSGGNGQFPTHIGPELFRVKYGLDMLHVPYKGAGPAMVDAAAGRVTLVMTAGLAAAKPFLDSGKVRAIAITGEKRSAILPEVPTFAESGYPLPEINAGTWFGLMGPAGLPRDIVARLSQTLNQALVAPDFIARLNSLTLEPMSSTPEAFSEFIRSAMDTWAQIVKRTNITPE